MIYNKTRVAAMAAGAMLLATSASLNISSATDGGAPLVSPTVVAIAVVALATAISVPSVMFAWRERRRGVALVTILFLLCGEGFNGVNSAERLLATRDARAQAAVADNRPYENARQRMQTAEETYQRADVAAAAEAGRGGCGRICHDLRDAAENARLQLEDARAVLERTPPQSSEHVLSTTIGWASSSVELLQAGLFTVALNGLGFMLLAIGDSGRSEDHSRVNRALVNSPSEPRRRRRRVKFSRRNAKPRVGPTRAEQIGAFCRSFRESVGREPTFTEVREATKLPNSTVSKYRRVALAA
jgi:hypothetical protein